MALGAIDILRFLSPQFWERKLIFIKPFKSKNDPLPGHIVIGISKLTFAIKLSIQAKLSCHPPIGKGLLTIPPCEGGKGDVNLFLVISIFSY